MVDVMFVENYEIIECSPVIKPVTVNVLTLAIYIRVDSGGLPEPIAVKMKVRTWFVYPGMPFLLVSYGWCSVCCDMIF
jgi:hypothetical protein